MRTEGAVLDARASGVGGQGGLLGCGGSSAADPLSVEPDRPGHFADRFAVFVDCLKDCGGEFSAGLLFCGHGSAVRAAEPPEGPVAIVAHVHIVPQGVRHHLVAYVHGDQSDTLAASLHSA